VAQSIPQPSSRPVKITLAFKFQVPMFWLKDVAAANMNPMLVTALVFHKPTGWLNGVR